MIIEQIFMEFFFFNSVSGDEQLVSLIVWMMKRPLCGLLKCFEFLFILRASTDVGNVLKAVERKLLKCKINMHLKDSSFTMACE